MGIRSNCNLAYRRKATQAAVILSERSESKDLRTDFLLARNEMRRSLDSALCAPLGMTHRLKQCVKLQFEILSCLAVG